MVLRANHLQLEYQALEDARLFHRLEKIFELCIQQMERYLYPREL